MNKTNAIKHALSNVSQLSQIGFGWMYSVFSPRHNAWVQTTPMNYWQASDNRRRDLITSALSSLHPERRDANYYDAGEYVGGTWQSWVK